MEEIKLNYKEFTYIEDWLCGRIVNLIATTYSEFTGHPSDDIELTDEIEDAAYGYGIIPAIRDSVLMLVGQLAVDHGVKINSTDAEDNTQMLAGENIYLQVASMYQDLGNAVMRIQGRENG